MAKAVGAAGERADGATILRLVEDVTVPLERLGRASADLVQLDETTGTANLDGILSKVRRHAAHVDQGVARLAPHTGASVADVAGDLSEAADTLATRWDKLVAPRRASVVELLTARRSELAALLAAISREAIARGGEAEADPVAPTPRPTPPRAPKGSAAQAWEEWNSGTDADGAAACLRLSQSWIEGTGAQLVRDERLRSSAWSNVSEVTARVRHHLVLLAGGDTVSYMDALATARHRVIQELRGSVDPQLSLPVARPEVAGPRRARPRTP